MFRRQFDRYIQHAPELRDEYHALMAKAMNASGVTYEERSKLGVKSENIVLYCPSDDDAETAISICEKWANGRSVSWFALPACKTTNDLLEQNRYVGCRLSDNDGTMTTKSTVRRMLDLPQQSDQS